MLDVQRQARAWFRTAGALFPDYYLDSCNGRLHLDCNELCMILCAWLLKYPTEVLEVLEAEADDILGWYVDGTGERDGRRWEEQTTVIQPFGLDSVAGPRGLTHSDMDTLVAVRGVVAKCGIVLPNMEVAYFACSACKYPSPQCVRGGHVLQPEHCEACHLSDLGIVHNMSTFQDMQHVELQEVAEDIPQGQTPCTLTLCLFGEGSK